MPHPPRRAALAALLGLAVQSACGGEPPALTVGELAWRADELPGLDADRRLLLGELAALGLTVARDEVARVGEPLVARRLDEHRARLVVAEAALEEAGVGDDVLRARYETDPALELTVRHLLVFSSRAETEATRRAARDKAVRALERIRDGEPFPAVAADVSEEPGAEGREGLLSPGREGSWVTEFWSAARALAPGEVSGVVETRYGFHVLRLEARDTVPFGEARPALALEVADMLGAPESPPPPDGLSVDREALARLAGRDGPLAAAARGAPVRDVDGEPGAGSDPADDSTAVATWDGGRLTVADLARHMATVPRPRHGRALASAEALETLVREAAAVRAATREARRRGLEPGPGVRDRAAREWSERVDRWAPLLGFRRGAGDEAVRRAARAALGATGQNAGLARDEVHAVGPLLAEAYPIRLARETGPAGPP